MTPTISIIIPIYNVDKYLEKCITSIINQHYTDFEVLLINDGSTDNSEEVCKLFTEDKRIRYHKKENAGVSSARNFGLEKAIGKYICFIDPDDYVTNCFLQDFIDNVKPFSLVIQDLNQVDNEEIKPNYQEYKNKIINLPKDIIEYISDYRITQGYIWNKIFEKEIIINNNILFNEKIKKGEDEDFCFQYINYVNQVILLDKANYYYVKRDNSLTKKNPTFESEFNRMKNNFKFLDYLKKCSENHPHKEDIKIYIKMRFNMLFNYTLRTSLYKNKYTKKERINSLKKLSKLNEEYIDLLESQTILQKIDYFLLKNNLFHILDIILFYKSKYN